LLERAKLLVDVEGAGGTIPEELGLNGEPGDMGDGVVLRDGVGETMKMVLRSLVRTTQSMRTQSGEWCTTSLERTWCSKENVSTMRRNGSYHRV
jgi:hypothetical protein